MEPFVIKRFTLPFRGEEPNFQEQLQSLEVAASKFNIKGLKTLKSKVDYPAVKAVQCRTEPQE